MIIISSIELVRDYNKCVYKNQSIKAQLAFLFCDNFDRTIYRLYVLICFCSDNVSGQKQIMVNKIIIVLSGLIYNFKFILNSQDEFSPNTEN